jgi:hypothetical protein
MESRKGRLMSVDVIKSYLVSLSAESDMASFTKLDGVLKTTETTVKKHVGGMVGDLLGFQVAATGVFAAVGFSIIGYIDHLAMLDQKQKLGAIQNMMSVQQYRAVSGALDVMGVSLDEVFHGTKQMQDQFGVLMNDSKQMDALLGKDYEQQMMEVRNVIFQFDRLELKAQRFGMMFASDLLKKLGFGDDGIGKQLERLNAWVLEKMPQWSDELSTDIIPVLHDFWEVLSGLGSLFWSVASDFVRLTGILTGDDSLSQKEVSFDSFAKTVAHVADEIARLIGLLHDTEQFGAHTLGAILFGVKDLKGTLHGETGEQQTANADAAHSELTKAWHYLYGDATEDKPSTPTSTLSGFLDSQGMVTDKLMAALAHTESGGNPLAHNAKSDAEGMYQIMPANAAAAGINAYDPAQAATWSRGTMNKLLAHYKGNLDYALAAYNFGEGKLDSLMNTGHYVGTDGKMRSQIPQETMDYVKKITGDTLQLTIHVHGANGTPEQLAGAVKKGAVDAYREMQQRQMAQLNGAYAN